MGCTRKSKKLFFETYIVLCKIKLYNILTNTILSNMILTKTCIIIFALLKISSNNSYSSKDTLNTGLTLNHILI